MLLSAVSVLVVAQSSSEIPEGLLNNPVFLLDYLNVFPIAGAQQPKSCISHLTLKVPTSHTIKHKLPAGLL